ncbi:uncharacterized protein [Musca autumnalis]|uniref:uncharacterized protein n=1 Tax=Musca autumnalis TaxID=221902 RepID=UPI003CE889CC
MGDHLTYPVYFLQGYLGYENEEMWDITSSELEMIDIEADSTDEEDVTLSCYDVVKIDEYEVSNTMKSQEFKISNNKIAIQQINKPFTLQQNSTNNETIAIIPQYTQTSEVDVITNSTNSVVDHQHSNCTLNVCTHKSRYSRENTHNDAVIEKWSPYLECPICKFLYPKFGALRQHFKVAHSGSVCHIICCGKILSQSNDIVHHIYASHQYELEPDVSSINITREEYEQFVQHYIPTMKCALCLSEYNGFSHLKEHFAAYHSPEVCFIACCNRKFATLEAITEHIRAHLDPQTFHCRLCKKSYVTKICLDRHLRQIHAMTSRDLLNYHCSQIPNENRAIARLKFNDIDAFIADFVAKLKCAICNCELSNYDKYTRHFAICHPCYKCKIVCCDLDFHSRHDFEEHIYLHSDPSGFMCIVCNQKFTKRSSLYAHMCQHHPFAINNDMLSSKWVEEFNEKNIPKPPTNQNYKKVIRAELKAIRFANETFSLKKEVFKAIHHLLLEWSTRAYLNGDRKISVAQIKEQAGELRQILNVANYRCHPKLFIDFNDAIARKSEIIQRGTMFYSLNYMDILENCKHRIHPAAYARFKERLRRPNKTNTNTKNNNKPL